MRTFIIFFVCTIGAYSWGNAQLKYPISILPTKSQEIGKLTIPDEPLDELEGNHFGSIFTDLSIASRSVFWDFGAGYWNKNLNLEVNAAFHRRLGSKALLIEAGPNTFYQYYERRYIISIGAIKYFRVIDFIDVYAEMRGGLQWGRYRGVATGTGSSIVPMPGVGIRLLNNIFRVKLGAEYLQLPQVIMPRVRVKIGVQLLIG